MKTIASILILFGLAASAIADPAEVDAKYFHPAASLYIHGDSTSASNLVVKGLSIYPDDGKLKRLKELLDKPPEQNKEDQQQDQKQDDQQQDQQNQDQQEDQPQQPEPQNAEQMSADEARQLMDAMRQEEENKRLQLHPVMGAPVKVDKDW